MLSGVERGLDLRVNHDPPSSLLFLTCSSKPTPSSGLIRYVG